MIVTKLKQAQKTLNDVKDNVLEFPKRIDELERKFQQLGESIRHINETLKNLDNNTDKLHELEMESWFKKADRKMKIATRDDVKNNKGG